MKVLFIPAKHKSLGISSMISGLKIKEKYSIVTTVQFVDEIKGAVQILGCNIKNVKNTPAYLYVGTGTFHPLNLAFQTKKRVYTLNPITKEFSKISEDDVKNYEKKKIGAINKYLHAKVIGILISTKPGQNQLKKALDFQKKCGKESYLFMCNEIKDLENYPQIECWVNTACPRIFEDEFLKNVVNLRDIEKFIYK